MEGPNQGTKKGIEHIPATQAVGLNDLNVKTRGLPCDMKGSRASDHGQGEPARSRVFQAGQARLWVQTVLHRSRRRGGGLAVGEW